MIGGFYAKTFTEFNAFQDGKNTAFTRFFLNISNSFVFFMLKGGGYYKIFIIIMTYISYSVFMFYSPGQKKNVF